MMRKKTKMKRGDRVINSDNDNQLIIEKYISFILYQRKQIFIEKKTVYFILCLMNDKIIKQCITLFFMIFLFF